jgi:hypothetical protein
VVDLVATTRAVSEHPLVASRPVLGPQAAAAVAEAAAAAAMPPAAMPPAAAAAAAAVVCDRRAECQTGRRADTFPKGWSWR